MKLVSLFEWVFHLGQNQVLDSDAMLLHVQERLLHEGKDHNWKSAFYMPAAADTGETGNSVLALFVHQHWGNI